MGLTERELTERSGSRLETVRRLVSLGIIVQRETDGPFDASDVHVVRLMEAFEQAGIGLDVIARGIAAGELSYENLRFVLPEPPPLARTSDELAAEAGRSPDFVRRLLGEFGLPQPPGDGRLREDDARMLADTLVAWDLAEDEELVRLARLYGDNVRRVTVSELELSRAALFTRIRRFDVSDAEKRRLFGERGAQITGLAERLLVWLHRRHREHEILSYIVEGTEEHLEKLGMAPKRPRRPPGIAFLDLTGYTALTEEQGDEAAAELAGRLAGVVNEAAQSNGGRPVKSLGDGVMFYFPEPARAVSSALDLVERIPAAVGVRARVGVHAGRVIFREGDYFGKAVNAAARIADYARPGEVLVSDEVRGGAHVEGVEFRPIGPVALKGLKEELVLHTATRTL